MHHVGVVVDDLRAAVSFFQELGLELEGEASVGGDWVDRVVGLHGVESEVAMLRTPDGQARLELSTFASPPSPAGDRNAPSNAHGLRHVSFLVEDIDDVLARLRAHGAELVGQLERYEDTYRLCYVRGPEGIIVELAEELA
jgi:catechol 2,3-dioxygenase-like lactoylglutathione lyase family enzyme